MSWSQEINLEIYNIFAIYYPPSLFNIQAICKMAKQIELDSCHLTIDSLTLLYYYISLP